MDDRKLTLSVTGMTCAACASSVERVLSGIDSITKVEVNLTLERATISFPEKFSELLFPLYLIGQKLSGVITREI